MLRSFLLIICSCYFLSGCYLFKHHRTIKPAHDDLDIVKQLSKKYKYVGLLTAELPKELDNKQQKQLKKLISRREILAYRKQKKLESVESKYKFPPYAKYILYVLNFDISSYLETFMNRYGYSKEASEIMRSYIEGKYKGHKVHAYLLQNSTGGLPSNSLYLFLFEHNNKINLVIHDSVRIRRYYHVIKSGLYIQLSLGRPVDQNIDSHLENLLKKK